MEEGCTELLQGKCCLDIRKKIFYYETIKHWTRLSREVVESPSLETLKTCPNRAPGNLIIRGCAFSTRQDQRSPPDESWQAHLSYMANIDDFSHTQMILFHFHCRRQAYPYISFYTVPLVSFLFKVTWTKTFENSFVPFWRTGEFHFLSSKGIALQHEVWAHFSEFLVVGLFALGPTYISICIWP